MVASFGFSYRSPSVVIPETVPYAYDTGQRFNYDNSQHDLNPNNSFYFHFPDDPRNFNNPYDFSGYQKPNIFRNLHNELFTDPYGTMWGNYMGVAYGNGPAGSVGNGGYIRGAGGTAGGIGATGSLGYNSLNGVGGINGASAYQGTNGFGYAGSLGGGIGYTADGAIGFLGGGRYAVGNAFFSYGGGNAYTSSYSPSFTMNDLRSVVLNRKDKSAANYDDYTGTVYGEALHWIEAFATVASKRTQPTYINNGDIPSFNAVAKTNPTGIQSAFGKNLNAVPRLNELAFTYGGLNHSPVWQKYIDKHVMQEHGGNHNILAPLQKNSLF